MPVVVNPETGLAENLPDDQAGQALKSGTHHIPLNDPDGNPVTAPLGDAANLLKRGYSQPNPEQLQSLMTVAEKSTPAQQALTAVEGAASAMTFGLSTGLERVAGGVIGDLLGKQYGTTPQDILARAEVNPGVHAIGEMGGLGLGMFYGAGEAGLIGKGVGTAAKAMTAAGDLAAGAVGLGNASGVLGMGARGLVKGLVENSMMAAGDEVSHLMASDPAQSLETAASHLGGAALLGGEIGGGLGVLGGGVGKLWKVASESKVSQMLHDFRGRMKQHIDNPNPVEAVQEQLTDFYKNIKSAADDVYGATGLKSQEINKLVPQEMTEAVGKKAQDVWDRVATVQKEMATDPDVFPVRLQNQFAKDARMFQETLTKPGVTPAETFGAIQRLKQVAQDWSQGYVKPIDEAFGFVQKMREIGPSLRADLEDAAVWGKAAERQKAINGAFSKFRQPLKDFEKRFTVEVNGVRQINPAAVNTYMNQLGSANAEIKKEMLGNFMKAADDYSQVIHESHVNLGIESPIQSGARNAIDDTLGTLSAGAKLADTMVKKALAKASGQTMGAGAGAVLGTLAGGPIGGTVGGAAGAHILGPMIESILPGIVKPLLDRAVNAQGFQSAIDFGMALRKGEALLSNGARAVFKEDKHVLPEAMRVSEAKLKRLSDRVDHLQKDPTALLEIGDHTGHYLPDHQTAMGMTAARALTYLQTLKPNRDVAAPLDGKTKPNSVQEGTYKRALTLVQQPMTAIQHLKDGRLTSGDMKTLSSVYPGWLSRMQSKVMAEMIESKSKGKLIPYKTRMGLSVFLGTPLDSTMTPQAMQLMRPPAPPQMPPPGGAKKNQSGLNKMGKANKLYLTPNQQAESRRMAN